MDGDATHTAVGTSATPRIGVVVAWLDRLFPLGWLGFYLLLPVSGWASLMFRSWFDQKRDLTALRAVIETGHSDAIAGNGIGPAYIAAADALHRLLGLGAQDSLVVLNRASYALSVALGILVVGVIVRRVVDAPPLVPLGAQFAAAALVFAAGTWHWSDVPWSHFFATFLALGLYALRFAPARLGPWHAAGIGAVLAALALARSFELVAVVLAWAIAAVLLWALRLVPRPRLAGGSVLAGIGGLVTTTAVVYGLTGKRDLFFLYSGSLGDQSGNVAAAEVARTPTFSFQYLPEKLVQLFVEPCYYAMCSVADYAGGAVPLPPALAGAAGNEKLWRLPLAVQLPSLVLLPVCLAALAVIVVGAARGRGVFVGHGRELRGLVEMSVAATGLVVGYAASTMTGSSHLRYGFARDFLLPALLGAVVAVSLGSVGLWRLLERRRLGLTAESVFVLTAVAASAAVVLGAAYTRAHGIPRLEGKQLGVVTYTADCAGGRCDVSLRAQTSTGRAIGIPSSSTLTFGCGSDRPRLTLYAASLNDAVRLSRPCVEPRLVAAWPTVAGLPPGSYELYKAVRVVNASG